MFPAAQNILCGRVTPRTVAPHDDLVAQLIPSVDQFQKFRRYVAGHATPWYSSLGLLLWFTSGAMGCVGVTQLVALPDAMGCMGVTQSVALLILGAMQSVALLVIGGSL